MSERIWKSSAQSVFPWDGIRSKPWAEKTEDGYTRAVYPSFLMLRARVHRCLSTAIPHKERLATLHAICLQISRHISQKCS